MKRSSRFDSARKWRGRLSWLPVTALIAVGAASCNQTEPTANAPPPEPVAEAPAPQGIGTTNYGEYLARPEELAAVGTNEIVRSSRLYSSAIAVGREVYAKSCASCHGADLKGSKEQHAPDLSDPDWTFAGDDLDTGGLTKFPSDVEWTVRYGVRTDHVNTRGLYADMVAYDPKFRTEKDAAAYGKGPLLIPPDIADVVEYVLKISGQEFDAAKAARGDTLFHNEGACFDCHGGDGEGNPALGSANLTNKGIYLYGSDRESILTSIVQGRRSTMPAFNDILKPEEIKAVSVFVHSRARK